MPASDRRGAVAVLSAALAAVLIGFAGLAIDTTRAWVAEARMKSALDAAALVAARRGDLPRAQRDALAEAAFWANVEQGNRGRGVVGATISDFAIQDVPNERGQVRVSARVTTPTILFNVIQAQTIRRDDASVARRGTGLELALVMDTTSSMLETATSLPGRPTKLQAAQRAANRLVNVLYGCREVETRPGVREWQGCEDTQPNLFVSVVPMHRNLNLGAGPSAALRGMGARQLDRTQVPAGWTDADFNGCVEARTGAPSQAPWTSAPLQPFAWPSTFQQVGQYLGPGNPNNQCGANDAYPPFDPPRGDFRRFCHGENDWRTVPNASAAPLGPAGSNGQGNNNEWTRYVTQVRGLPAGMAAGPNFLCTPSAVTPPTARRQGVSAAIDGLVALGLSGGTLIAPALEGAWWTLSPQWRNLWRDDNAGVAGSENLPRDYDAPNNRKAMIILTDGDNNWLRVNNYYGDGRWTAGRTVRAAATGSEANNPQFYTAYGRVPDWNAAFPSMAIGGSRTPDQALDQRFEQLCAAIKATDQNGTDRIQIYVIGFEVGAGAPAQEAARRDQMLERCASIDESGQRLYYRAADAAQLDGVFEDIAADLVRLRLVP